MNDIAQRTGFSRATVSYVLNGRHSDRLGKETCDRVLAAAKEMGYSNNELARAVATGKSHILGIVANKGMSDGVALTIAGALEEAAEHGYTTKLLFVPFDADPEIAKRIMQRCTAWRLDGALVVSTSEPNLEILRDEMSAGNRPVAFVGNIPPEGGMGAYSDDTYAWREAVRYLYDLGHRHIRHIAARPTSTLSQLRASQCESVLREFDLTVDESTTVFTTWNRRPVIWQGVEQALNAPQRPTALLCSSDNIAATALRVARSRGLEVPTDLSVVGFGNQDFVDFLDPSLTSIAQPHEEVARHAVRQLLARIEMGPGEGTLTRLCEGYEIIVRESTGPPRCNS